MPAGRPEKPIDWELVDRLLEAGCSGMEIAPYFNVHYQTFYDRVQEKYGVTFTEYAATMYCKGEACLRQVQYEKAICGDNVQLVWLGKNRLKQKENPTEVAVSPETIYSFNKLMRQISQLQSSRKTDAAVAEPSEDHSESQETKEPAREGF